MKNDRTIMNELARNSKMLCELTEEQTIRLKATLLEMYQDIHKVCMDSGLNIILCGGSALGAIRHKGFIPWDDDLDLAMYREDLNKFLELIKEGALGEKYEYCFPSKENDTRNLFVKIFLKGTTCSEVLDAAMPFPHGIFIDIFPIENAVRPGFLSKLKGNISSILYTISVCVLYNEYPSKEYYEFMSLNPEALKRYKMRMFIGKLFSFVKHKTWAYWFDSFVQKKCKTGYLTIPSGIKRYNGELVKEDVLFPVSKGMFEGIEVELPNNPDAYLKHMYGDYMWIPPVEKRERHFVYKFSFEN